MSDDKHDDYNSRMLHERHAQKLRRINQRKGHCFIQESNDDEDDKDDEYDSVFFCLNFPNRNAQNLRRINQRKGICFIHE